MKKNLTTPDGAAISNTCFGTMQFGGNADETASRQMYDACREASINFFDTAFVYNKGNSETLLGKFAADERDAVFVATKCAFGGGAGKENIHAQFDESRKRLGMDFVDLLYIHRWNTDTALEETFETLAGLVETGKTRFIGVSNFAAWQVMKAQRCAASFGIEIAMLQPMYNLVKRQAEVEILPMALSEGFAVCPYSPLGGGLLTGKYARGDTGRLSSNKHYASRYRDDWMHKTAAQLADLALDIGVSAATLAVAWVARNPAVTAPIISARSLEQLRPSLDAASYDLNDKTYQKMSALSITPQPATDRSETT
ncbi:MAG: aldo/keto reductase [Marinosulfonomonas sp.]|nr:aldo/keto reductase [Marinosulfonomonas sp.]